MYNQFHHEVLAAELNILSKTIEGIEKKTDCTHRYINQFRRKRNDH